MFTGAATEAQTNQYPTSNSAIKTIEKKLLKLRYCFMACAPQLGHFIGRCEAYTWLELSKQNTDI